MLAVVGRARVANGGLLPIGQTHGDVLRLHSCSIPRLRSGAQGAKKEIDTIDKASKGIEEEVRHCEGRK